MSSLRLIAVHVEEPKPGKFAWVLTERTGRAWSPLQRSRTTERTYRQAMAEGLVALQSLVEDLDAGPRTGEGDRRESETVPQHEDASESETRPAGKPYFGFGPAR